MQLSPGAFVSDRFQGPRDRPGPQDSLNRSALKSLIAKGVFDCPMDILTLIIFLQPQDGAGVEPTVAGMSCGESLEKRPGHLSEGQKSLPNRLQTVADFLGPKVIRVFHPFAQAGRISFMSSDELNLRRINQDLLLRGLEAQNVGDMAGGNGVEIRFKLNKPVTTADAQRHLGAVIRMKGQRLKGFLGKEFQRGMPSRVMDMKIGLLF